MRKIGPSEGHKNTVFGAVSQNDVVNLAKRIVFVVFFGQKMYNYQTRTDMNYIKVGPIYNKIKQALKDNKILYIKGSAGMGKSAAVEYFFRRKSVLHLHAEEGFIDEIPAPEDIREEVLIFDDISQMTDERSRDFVLDCIDRGDHNVILIGRGNIPGWLIHASMEYDFAMATNDDLLLSDENIRELFANMDSTNYIPDDEDLLMIKGKTSCNTAALIFVARHMPSQETFLNNYILPAMHDFYHYLDHVFFDRLDDDVRNAFLNVCLFEHFNSGLLRQLSAETHVHKLLDDMVQSGDIITENADGFYTINEPYLGYFKQKVRLALSSNRINEIYERAAVYYELHDDLLSALHCYRDSGNAERLEDALMKYAKAFPGQEDFKKLIPLYKLLPEERILKQPALMTGYSICYSLAVNPQKSEYWYDALSAFAKSKNISTNQKREAEARLKYLDIMLPHRSKADQIDKLIGKPITAEESKEFVKGVQSLLNKTPSLLNGTMDFCDVMHEHASDIEDENFIKAVNTTTDSFFGTQAIGFIDILTAEYKYETCSIDSHSLQTAVNKAFLEAEMNNATEMCCAAGSLIIRDCLDNGRYNAARSMFDSFRKKYEEGNDQNIIALLELYDIWLNMIVGNNKPACDWMERSPSSLHLSIAERHSYILKVRSLIMLQRFDEAMFLIMTLESVFKDYHRPYNSIQLHVLHAILLFRQGNDAWKDELTKALTISSKYGFVHVVADEGAAVKPLLDAYSNKDIPGDYLSAVKNAVRERSIHFPNYMLFAKPLEEPLTETEHRVIKLMCQELGSDEICDIMCISYSGLKFHRQNIYRKLNAKNRSEAQRAAKSLGLDL